MEQMRRFMGDEGVKMCEWFDEVGFEADIAALRRDHPEDLDVEARRGSLRDPRLGGCGDLRVSQRVEILGCVSPNF